jgi:hypothetical protein
MREFIRFGYSSQGKWTGNSYTEGLKITAVIHKTLASSKIALLALTEFLWIYVGNAKGGL